MKPTHAEWHEALAFTNKLRAAGKFKQSSPGELARATGLSLRALNRGLSLIRKLGCAAIVASVDYSKLPAIDAFIGVKTNHPKYNAVLTEKCANLPFVIEAKQVNGGFATHLLRTRTPSMALVNELVIDELNGKCTEEVETTQTLLANNRVFEEHLYYYDKENTTPATLDAKDWKLLAALKQDARRSLSELRKEIGLSEPAIFRRVKRLEQDGIITGYYCTRRWNEIPPEQRPIMADIAITVKSAQYHPTAQKLAFNRAGATPSYAHYVYGHFDLIAAFTFKDLEQYSKFRNEELANLPGIGNITTYQTLDIRLRDWMNDYANYFTKLED